MQDADLFLTLESRLLEHEGSSLAPTPLGSPPDSMQDSSLEMFDIGHSQLSQVSISSNDAMVLESGVGRGEREGTSMWRLGRKGRRHEPVATGLAALFEQ